MPVNIQFSKITIAFSNLNGAGIARPLRIADGGPG
jgi:hypothetical protein